MFAARAVSRVAAPAARRSISVSSVKKDLVQDLYLKELKAYKAPPVDPKAHLASVRQFNAPSAPSAPSSLSSSLAQDLETYDATAVDFASATGKDGAAAEREQTMSEFYEELRADVVKPAEHH